MTAGARRSSLPEGDLTMLFSDIEGSTRLLHEIRDLYGEVLANHHAILRKVWAAHDGLEVHADGDAFLVVFNKVANAIKAAVAGQDALASHAWPHGRELRVRMGIHSGEARVRNDDYWGIDVHYAARLCGAAHGGQVLLSAASRALAGDVLVEDLGEHALKDFPAPRRIYHLALPGRSTSDFPPPRTLTVVRSNLPSVPTAIVGREAEIEAVHTQFDSGRRLVTITGIGGSGKTRLALACGESLLPSFADGAFLVTLASVADASGVMSAIGEALGIAMQEERAAFEMVSEHLRDRELLLILDNMEHLLPASQQISELIAAAPGLSVLATSQAPLQVQGESLLALDSLEPGAAMTLLVERARELQPSFAVTPENSAAVTTLCDRLERLPLALELAAARLQLAGPDQLLRAIERGIDALGTGRRDLPERQRGLRAALDWTVSLLGDDERALFAGLGAFAEAWTIEQLERMFGDTLDVWEGSAALMHLSLIRTRGDGRFTMAEAVRTYARELLETQGRADEVRERHAAMLAEEAEAIHDEFFLDYNAQKARTLDRLREFEAARTWAAHNSPALHRRLVGALGLAYHFSRDMSVLSEDILALSPPADEQDEAAARLLISQAIFIGAGSNQKNSADLAEDAAELYRRLGNVRAEARALVQAAHLLTFLDQDEIARGRELLRTAGEAVAADPDPRIADLIESAVAINLFASGDWDGAETMLGDISADSTRTDLLSFFAPSYMADCAVMSGRFEQALARFAAYVRVLRGTDTHNMLLQCAGIVVALAGLGRDAEAIELQAAIIATLPRYSHIHLERELYPQGPELLERSRTRLGQRAVAEAEQRGAARTIEDIEAWVVSMAPAIEGSGTNHELVPKPTPIEPDLP
jgi:predicted ATPase/class 3 adenylate cyclase